MTLTKPWFWGELGRHRLIIRSSMPNDYRTFIEVFALHSVGSRRVLVGRLTYSYDSNGDYYPVVPEVLSDSRSESKEIMADRVFAATKKWPDEWRLQREAVCLRQKVHVPVTNHAVLVHLARLEGMARVLGRFNQTLTDAQEKFTWETAIRLSSFIGETNRRRADQLATQE